MCVSGFSIFHGNTTILSDLNIVNASFKTLNVNMITGTTDLNVKNVTVLGETTILSTLNVSNSTILNGTNNFNSTTINSELTVSGITQLNGYTTIISTLTTNTLTLTGKTIFYIPSSVHNSNYPLNSLYFEPLTGYIKIKLS